MPPDEAGKLTIPHLPHFRPMFADRFLISVCVATQRNLVQPALAPFLRGAPPYRPVILCCFARLLLAEPQLKPGSVQGLWDPVVMQMFQTDIAQPFTTTIGKAQNSEFLCFLHASR